MAAYATYSYYSATFLGTAIAEADFPRLVLRASAQIDRVTFGRAAPIITANTDTDTIDAIKMATCEIAETLQTIESADGADVITSESQGQYSVSYGEGSSRLQTSQQKIQTAARLWLENTDLLFTGFAAGEYSGESDTE